MPTAARKSVLPAVRSVFEPLEGRRLMHGDVDVTFDFRPAGTPGSAGTLGDFGNAYAPRGNGYAYGWSADGQPADNRKAARDRGKVADQRLDTLIHLQQGGSFAWDLEIPNGSYTVTLAVGDSADRGGRHHVLAEGSTLIDAKQTAADRFPDATASVIVADGKLTLRAGPRAQNAKLLSVRVHSAHDDDQRPTVTVAASAPDAAEGDSPGEFRLVRSAEHLNEDLTVKLKWTGAAGASDVQARPTSVTFDASSSTALVEVRPVDDDLDEAPENATVTLAPNGGPWRIGSPRAASVLIDGAEPAPQDPPTVTITAPDAEATEGGEGGTVRLARTGDTSDALVVDLAWSGSAGNADVDARPGSVTFPAGAATLDVSVVAVDDALDEEVETANVRVVASDDYEVGDPDVAAVTIEDNDGAAPTFTNINWASTTAPPVSLSESTSATVGGNIYLFGGFNGVFQPQRNVYRFDGTSWTTLGDSPTAFTHVGHAVVDGKVWVAGGYLGRAGGGQTFGTTDVRVYDPANDSWAVGPSLPEARASGNLVKVGRTLYFFGGETLNRAADSTTMWSLDLDASTPSWSNAPSMPLARNHASAIAVDGKVYVLGGQTGFDGGLTAHDDIQIFDPATNAWTLAPQTLPANRSHTVSATQLYRGQIVIVTGQDRHNGQVNTVYRVDPTTLATTTMNAFPDARFSVATGILNDKLYAFGGYRGTIATNAFVGTFV